MAAGARPRNCEPLQQAAAQLSGIARGVILVRRPERRVSHTAVAPCKSADRSEQYSVEQPPTAARHRTAGARRPTQARRSSRCWPSTSRISRSRTRTRRARCSQTRQQPQINIQINVNAKPLDRDRLRGRAQARGQGRSRRQRAVQLRADVRRRVPHPERAAGERAAADDDRVPAAAVPVRARDHRHRGAQRRLPAAAARSDRFRRALSAAHGAGAAAARRAPRRRSTSQ